MGKKYRFSLIGRKTMVMGMGSDRIIEARNISQEALLELVNRFVATAVQLLLLQVLEKALHYCVVIGMTFGREGLDHAQFVNDLAEILQGKSIYFL